MRVTIVTNGPSNSARNLQAALRLRGGEASRARPTSRLSCRGTRYVINLGVSAALGFQQRRLLVSNSQEGVRNCQDKRLTFDALRRASVSSLEWGETQEGAVATWLERDGKVVVRHTATGHSGAGIQIVRKGEQIPVAPLYTRYFKKQAEYRVHVAFGNVILIQQKRKRNGVEQENEQSLVRTHANGWVFSTQALSCNERGYRDNLCALGIAAANAIRAAHCAVDILVSHENGNNMVVCEINSAPALEANSTLAAYTDAFINEMRKYA